MVNRTYIQKNHPPLYYAIKKRKLKHLFITAGLDQFINHSEERTLKIARSYEGNYFGGDYPREYHHAAHHKYLSKLNIILDMYKTGGLSEEKTLELARNFKGTSGFSQIYVSEWKHAAYHKYLDKLNAILLYKIEHSEKRTLELARNYKGTCFSKDYNLEQQHASKCKYLDKLNIALKRKPPTNHSEERTLKIAKHYKGFNFAKDYPKEYAHAMYHKYLDNVNAIFGRSTEIRRVHSEKKTLELARNYKGTRFSKDYNLEYGHAFAHGYIDKLRLILYKK